MAQYEVLGRVATTRSGAVWKARDVGLDRFVALKQVGAADRDDLMREAAAIASIASEHVVAVYGVEEQDGQLFLVEEWVEGATVAAVLRANGPMPAPLALSILRGGLLGLAAGHARGFVHGDVSVSNILVDANGTARLIDFGSVAQKGERARASTGAFAAPEVLAGAPITPAADVFAAAAVFASVVQGHLDPAPSTDGIAPPVRAVLERAMNPDPAARYQDAMAFLNALEPAAQEAYGSSWWSTAGLGAAALGTTAAVVAIGAAFAGGSVIAGTGIAAGAGAAGAGAAGSVGAAGAQALAAGAQVAGTGAAGTAAAGGQALGAAGNAVGAAQAAGTGADALAAGAHAASSAGTAQSGGDALTAAQHALTTPPPTDGGATAVAETGHAAGHSAGKVAGKAAWHSKKVGYLVGGVGVVAAATVGMVVATGGDDGPSTPQLAGRWSFEQECGDSPVHQVLDIVQRGKHLVATKIVGNTCVPTGHVSFEGDLTGATSTITIYTGDADEGGTVDKGEGTLTVVDKNHLQLGSDFNAVDVVRAAAGSVDATIAPQTAPPSTTPSETPAPSSSGTTPGALPPVVPDSGGAISGNVEATSDIYLAYGPQVPTEPGTAPFAITVPTGATNVNFPSVNGEIAAGEGWTPHGPDGDNLVDASAGTDLTALNGISGVTQSGQNLFLVGVFAGSEAPAQTDVVDLMADADLASQAPGLGQPFYIGDGHTTAGDLQHVVVPSGATTLYLGFADGYSFQGTPGWYDDNSGALSVSAQFDTTGTSTSTTSPAPPPAHLATSGELVGYWTGDWGDLVMVDGGDGTIVGAYDHDDGVLVGTVQDGRLVGTWCEQPRATDNDKGPVQFDLVQNGTALSIDGRWKYASEPDGSAWREDWDVTTKSTDAPPDALVARANDRSLRCG